MTPLLVEIIDHPDYYTYNFMYYDKLWYTDKIGQRFEVVDYRNNPEEYYERVDRKNLLDKYIDNVSSIPDDEYDFFIVKKHCKIVDIHKEEIERILSDAITC